MTNLQALRKQRGLSQDQLAERLGVSRSTVAMWETGANVPTTKYLLDLARVLDCTVETLLRTAEGEQPA